MIIFNTFLLFLEQGSAVQGEGKGFCGVVVMSWIFILLCGKSLLWLKETEPPLLHTLIIFNKFLFFLELCAFWKYWCPYKNNSNTFFLCNTSGERMQKSSRQSVKLKRCEVGAALFLWVTIEIYRVIRWKFNSLPQPHGNLYPHTAQHCLALEKSRNVLKIIKIGMYVNWEMHLTSWPVSISRFNYIWKVLLKM